MGAAGLGLLFRGKSGWRARDMLYSLYGLCPYLAEQEKCSLRGLKIERVAFCVYENTPMQSPMERGRGTPDTAKRSRPRDTARTGGRAEQRGEIGSASLPVKGPRSLQDISGRKARSS